MKRSLVSLGAAALLLGACASTSEKAVTGVGQAVTSPLVDINLVHAHADIPLVLLAAERAPYAMPEDWSCPAIAAEIQEFDAALGADLDTPNTSKNPSLIERGAGFGVDTAVGQVRGVTDSVVPFRNWVRKLSGAERYSRQVSAAISAGIIRRAYLKGLGRGDNCYTPPPVVR